MQIKTGSFTGDGVSGRNITGIGFTPDLVIVKRTDAGDNAYFRTAAMTGLNSLPFRSDSGFETTQILGIVSDGFTVGNTGQVNENTKPYTYVCIRDNGAGDFKTFTYTGDGADGHAISVGFAPAFVCVKGNVGSTGAYRYSTQTVNQSSVFFVGGVQDWIKTFTSTGFTTNGGDFSNKNASAYYGFAFKAVPGLISVFVYTGNGADSRNISTPGFWPTYVWIKAEQSTAPCWRNLGHTGDNAQSFDGAQEGDKIQSFLSTGFQVGTNVDVNTNTNVYHALVIADQSRASTPGLFAFFNPQ